MLSIFKVYFAAFICFKASNDATLVNPGSSLNSNVEYMRNAEV